MDEKDEKDGAAAETAPPAVGTETPAGAGNDARARDAQETGDSTAESKGRPLLPSEHFTGHQKFYIFALDGVGGMTLSAGVNFAIAYVMYTTQDTSRNPIRLFQLPNTLAGDGAVTIIVQCVLTWFVEWFLVAHDLANRSVQPLALFPEPRRPLLRWLFLLGDHAPATKLANVGHQALRGFLLCVPAFVLLWPIGVGALTALGERDGGDYVYDDRWAPQLFKFVLGGVLGLLTTPLMATFWLVKAGWEGQRTRPVSEALGV